jgi:hypothetical protein
LAAAEVCAAARRDSAASASASGASVAASASVSALVAALVAAALVAARAAQSKGFAPPTFRLEEMSVPVAVSLPASAAPWSELG